MDRNQDVFDGVADTYSDLKLMGAERAVLERLADRLAGFDMLDLGVGAGRTGYTFAPLVNRYIGIDYSPRMIERARARLDNRPNVELVVADARDLSSISGSFDFALFSFNGIDAVGHVDRLRILAEVRAKLKPGGLFFFSAHSLGALPLSARRRRGRRSDNASTPEQLVHFAADLYYGLQVGRSNRLLDLEAALRRGWTIVRDPAHRFSLAVYYIEPRAQLAQLVETGLEPATIIAENGDVVDPAISRRDPWLNYLCRRPS